MFLVVMCVKLALKPLFIKRLPLIFFFDGDQQLRLCAAIAQREAIDTISFQILHNYLPFLTVGTT